MKLHQILWQLLILLLPLQLGYHFWPDFSFVLGIRVDYLSPTIYLTDLVVVGVLFSWFWTKKDRFTTQRYWYLFAIFLYLFLVSIFADNSGAALYKFLKILELFLVGFYVAKTKPWRITALPLALGLIYESLIVLAQFLKQASLGGPFWWLGERTFSAGTPGIALGEWGGRLFLRPYGTFSHPNSMGGFSLVGLILVWFLGKHLAFWLKLVVSLLVFLMIILSFSQAVWLAGLMVIALFLIVRFRVSKILALLLTACFLSLGFLFFLPNQESQSFQERVHLIKVALGMIKESPLTGIGLNNFIPHLSNFGNGGEIYLLQPVHNLFLLVAAETGLVGLLIFLWLLILTYKKLLRPLRYAPCASLTAILLLGLFDHYWLTLQQNQLLLAVVFGFLWVKRVE